MQDVDLIVIGAGIQGAGVAQAASACGYHVLLIEQYAEPAQGTSSRSSKLIHGGLRYLESGQFALVKECLQERSRLLKNAPHLVKLVPFYIPVYHNSVRSRFKIAAGLMLYSLLSLKPFSWISKTQWKHLDSLSQDGLKAVFKYYDAQTDDAQLTRSVLLSAQSLGTVILYQHQFESVDIHKDYCDLVCRTATGETKNYRCKAIVNASGPWVDMIASKVVRSETQPKIELVQGTHIEVPGKLEQGVYYLEAPQDQRAVFVMPWQEHLLIGTTETVYEGDPGDVKPLESEIEYLLEVYNHYFSKQMKRSDVLNAFAGLRVLPKTDGDAFNRPRDTLIIGNSDTTSRFWSLYGGKLTAYRATAEQVMAELKNVLPESDQRKRMSTRTLPLG